MESKSEDAVFKELTQPSFGHVGSSLITTASMTSPLEDSEARREGQKRREGTWVLIGVEVWMIGPRDCSLLLHADHAYFAHKAARHVLISGPIRGTI